MTLDDSVEDVLVRRDGGRGLLLVTVNRPQKANALTRSMLSRIIVAVTDVDPSTRGVVICGGENVFSAGVDLDEARQPPPADSAPSVQDLLTELMRTLRESPLPIVALVTGACVGGAVELVLGCDLRVGTPHASFRVPATEIGVVYRPQGYAALCRSLPVGTVRQLVLLGLSLDAETSRTSGILDLVVDQQDPLDAVADVLARLGRVPGTFAAQKSALAVVAAGSGLGADAATRLQQIRSAHESGTATDAISTISHDGKGSSA